MNRLHKWMQWTPLLKIPCPFRNILTDIIVGFCDETDDEFKKRSSGYNTGLKKSIFQGIHPAPTKPFLRNLDSRISVQHSELHKVCEQIKLESKRAMIGWAGLLFQYLK